MKTYRERAYIALVEKRERQVEMMLEAGLPLCAFIHDTLDMSPSEFLEFARGQKTGHVTVPSLALAEMLSVLSDAKDTLDCNTEDGE